MVGFGFMDNTILIRAGDAIDNALGDKFGLTGLECAACGQVLSDFSGVLFGGVIESMSRRFILPPALTGTQHALRITQIAGTAGAAIGVVIGCVLGMGNLLVMDLKEAERQKKLIDMQELFNKELNAAIKVFKAGAGSIFVIDEEKRTLWSFGATGIDSIIEVPLTGSSLVGWSAVQKRELNIADAYDDHRFNAAFDKASGRRTTSVLCTPVFAQGDDDKVIAVVQLLNKEGGFTDVDKNMAVMVADHTSIFLTALLEGGK